MTVLMNGCDVLCKGTLYHGDLKTDGTDIYLTGIPIKGGSIEVGDKKYYYDVECKKHRRTIRT